MKTQNSVSQKIWILWKSWAEILMVSKAGSVGYTIMGKTADLTVAIDILHKEGTPQKVIAKDAGCSECCIQAYS